MKSKFVTLKQYEKDDEYLIHAINETRETAASEDKAVLFYSILINTSFLVVGLALILFLQFQFVPHKICHAEVTTEVVNLGHYENIPDDQMEARGIGKDDKYLCEKGVKVDDLRSIGTIWFTGKDKICILEHHKEVCEIK